MATLPADSRSAMASDARPGFTSAEAMEVYTMLLRSATSKRMTDQMFAEMARVNMAAIRRVAAAQTPEFTVNPDVLSAPGFLAKIKR